MLRLTQRAQGRLESQVIWDRRQYKQASGTRIVSINRLMKNGGCAAGAGKRLLTMIHFSSFGIWMIS